MPIPYSANLLKNGSAQEGNLTHWEDAVGVTVVSGGVDDYDTTPYCFKFAPTASMRQNAPVGGLPPEVKFRGRFLPAQDIQRSSHIKSAVRVTLHYGDGSIGQYVIPGKTYIGGVF